MENHHAALAFAVLRRRGANVFEKFSREEFAAARSLMVDAILCTDMTHHFALTQELQKHSLEFSAQEEGDRALLVKVLLHAADVSNPIHPFPIALALFERVHEEFAQQAEECRSPGLPVPPHCGCGGCRYQGSNGGAVH
eukprot:jgi/Chrzof1/6023/Cz17g02070.t1